MNKEDKNGLHPIASIKSWLENLNKAASIPGLEQFEEPARYPVWRQEFDDELNATTTNTHKACIWAREGHEEMAYDYLFNALHSEDLSEEAYDQIYLLALERSAQNYEDRAKESTGDFQKFCLDHAESMREKAEVYRRLQSRRRK